MCTEFSLCRGQKNRISLSATMLIEPGSAMLANRYLNSSTKTMHSTGRSSKTSIRAFVLTSKDSMPIATRTTSLVATKSSWKH